MTRLNRLTDVPGVAVGHVTDLRLGSGVTAILFDSPATASVAVLGGAPGGRDIGLLDPGMTVERVDAIVLSGGSAFGLDAAGGVQAVLRARGRGLRVGGGAVVPIVPQAILFDLLNGGEKDWGRASPYWELGFAAAEAARDGAFALGSVGAGTGATTAMVKGGLGSASVVTPTGHVVAALVAVNALGSPLLGEGPHFWAAPFEQGAEFGGLGWPARLGPEHHAMRVKGAGGNSTTIGVIATNAALTKAQAKRIAIMAHDGLARAILPAHAALDGDTIFAAATGARALVDPIADLTTLGHAASLTMARAIGVGVYAATALPVAAGQAAWRDRFAGVDRGPG